MFKYKELNSKYGDQTLQKVRRYEQLSISRAKFKSHLHFNLHCKHHNVIPKSLKMKSPVDNEQARHLLRKTERVLLNIRITDTIQKQKQINNECLNVENELKGRLPNTVFNTLKARNCERAKKAFEKSSESQKNKFRILTPAMHDLRNDESIVVLPADKGKCLVVMDKQEYIQKMEDKLKDQTTYKPINEDPSEELKENLCSLIDKIREKGELPKDSLYYKLRPTRTLIPRMYGQPKIHKENYPMREIVDGTGGVTKDIDKYISSIIKTYTGKSEHYVKNSAHFANMIKDLRVEEDEVLVSFDVVALYPSVPQNEAIDLVHEKMVNDPDLHKKTTMSAESITSLFKMCVQTTYFVFNKKLYMQVNGLAIGASTSGFAAEIFMERLETKALNTFFNPPSIWKRYVDDTFTKLKQIVFEQFLTHLNEQHPRIKFTSEVEVNRALAFLDNKVHREIDGSTKITIYRKKTHTDQYLDFTSNHHMQQKLGIIATFQNRINTLITKEEDKVEEENHVRKALKVCGYPEWTFKRNKKPKRNGDEKPEPYAKVVIPYTPKLSEKLAQKFRKYNIETVHKPTKKIKGIVCNKMKDKVHDLDKTGSVYHAGCLKGCERVRRYVGETKRVTRARLYEHRVVSHNVASKAQSLKPDETENKATSTKTTRTSNRKKAVINYKELNEGKHQFLTEGSTVVSAHVANEAHRLEDMFFEIVDQDDDWLNRGYKEAIAIKNLKPDLNEDEGRCYIPPIYDQIFRTAKYKNSLRRSKFGRADAELIH